MPNLRCSSSSSLHKPEQCREMFLTFISWYCIFVESMNLKQRQWIILCSLLYKPVKRSATLNLRREKHFSKCPTITAVQIPGCTDVPWRTAKSSYKDRGSTLRAHPHHSHLPPWPVGVCIMYAIFHHLAMVKQGHAKVKQGLLFTVSMALKDLPQSRS